MQRVLNPVKIVYIEISTKTSLQMKRSGSDKNLTLPLMKNRVLVTKNPEFVQLPVDLHPVRKPSTRLLERGLVPVYTFDRCKTPRLDDKTNDPTLKVADKAVQTDPVVYTKSIKTTTIVREHGCKTITMKREKML